jgi:hypothetical protein
MFPTIFGLKGPTKLSVTECYWQFWLRYDGVIVYYSIALLHHVDEPYVK